MNHEQLDDTNKKNSNIRVTEETMNSTLKYSEAKKNQFSETETKSNIDHTNQNKPNQLLKLIHESQEIIQLNPQSIEVDYKQKNTDNGNIINTTSHKKQQIFQQEEQVTQNNIKINYSINQPNKNQDNSTIKRSLEQVVITQLKMMKQSIKQMKSLIQQTIINKNEMSLQIQKVNTKIKKLNKQISAKSVNQKIQKSQISSQQERRRQKKQYKMLGSNNQNFHFKENILGIPSMEKLSKEFLDVEPQKNTVKRKTCWQSFIDFLNCFKNQKQNKYSKQQQQEKSIISSQITKIIEQNELEEQKITNRNKQRRWPELVGVNLWIAKELLAQQYPDIQIRIIEQNSKVISRKSLMQNCIQIFYNQDTMLVTAPPFH